MFKKIKKKIQSVPDRKRYVDFIAALFALPVMITVLVINIDNLKGKNEDPNATTPPQTIVVNTTPSDSNTSNTDTTAEPCIKKVGPIEIASPIEGQEITSSPVNITVRYDTSEYCAVVWSYRINNGQWSEYSSSSISIYNPPPGVITLDLRVQSTVSNDQTQLQRKFKYEGEESQASPSATPTQN